PGLEQVTGQQANQKVVLAAGREHVGSKGSCCDDGCELQLIGIPGRRGRRVGKHEKGEKQRRAGKGLLKNIAYGDGVTEIGGRGEKTKVQRTKSKDSGELVHLGGNEQPTGDDGDGEHARQVTKASPPALLGREQERGGQQANCRRVQEVAAPGANN